MRSTSSQLVPAPPLTKGLSSHPNQTSLSFRSQLRFFGIPLQILPSFPYATRHILRNSLLLFDRNQPFGYQRPLEHGIEYAAATPPHLHRPAHWPIADTRASLTTVPASTCPYGETEPLEKRMVINARRNVRFFLRFCPRSARLFAKSRQIACQLSFTPKNCQEHPHKRYAQTPIPTCLSHASMRVCLSFAHGATIDGHKAESKYLQASQHQHATLCHPARAVSYGIELQFAQHRASPAQECRISHPSSACRISLPGTIIMCTERFYFSLR